MFTYAYNEDFIVAGELLIEVDVIAHSSLTDYDALAAKSFTIFSNLGFWLESYLHLCFNIFKIASCNMSPISSTA